MYIKKLLQICTLIGLFCTSTITFAEDVTDFTIDSISGGSVEFSWNENENAPFAQIFYGENSSSDGEYTQESDLLEGDSHTIEGLTSNTDYYFVLEMYNSEGQQVAKSDELHVKIGGDGGSSGFRLKEIIQEEKDMIILYFSNDLDIFQEKENLSFKIEAIDNPNDYFEIMEFVFNPEYKDGLGLVLDKNITPGVEYKVIAINVLDENGNNIEYGIDSEAVFIGEAEEELTSGDGEINLEENNEIQEGDNQDSNISQTDEEETQQEDELLVSTHQDNISGETINQDQVKEDIHSASEKKKKLPDTGPEYLILFFLAMLIAAAVFIPKYTKNNID